MFYRYIGKRILDLLLATFGLILLSPLFIFLIILLAFVNWGSPFFVQARPGKNEKSFHILKFKTMNDITDSDGNLLPDKERLTWIGAKIRKTSLDEIPQLINIIRGEMSFIGPRPLLFKYLPYYTENERKRHWVRPGITGLAQVYGRNLLSWDQKFKKDCEYIENYCFTIDLVIFLKTIHRVIVAKDVLINPDIQYAPLDKVRRPFVKNTKN